MEAVVQRTSDVEISENVPFAKMLLSDDVLAGLAKCGFVNPSPIQLRAIPIGCCGLDLMIKAKSGTGKTLVFCTLILEKYRPDVKMPQSLIVVPTREISEQVSRYLNQIGAASPGFKAASFIGGRDIADDRKAISSCRAVVGTPGRLLHLISTNVLCMDRIKVFVMDESDKLLSNNFQSDVKKLIRELPSEKVQMLASSATFSDETNKILLALMKNPIGVTASRDVPILLGVKQCKYVMDDDEEWQTADVHTVSIRAMQAKVSAMKDIFTRIAFKQAIIFSNSQMRAESYCKYLRQIGWNADVISGSHEQSVRLATFERFKSFQARILVATDLMARGIDVENINLVINLDVPGDSATYLHRIGRCGRFGSHGTAITIIGNERELVKFNKMLSQIGGDQLSIISFRSDPGLELPNGNGTEQCQSSSAGNNSVTGSDAVAESVAHSDSAANNDSKPTKSIKTLTTNGKKIKKYTRNSLDVQTKNMQLFKLTQLMIDTDNANDVKLELNLFRNFNEQQGNTAILKKNNSTTRNSVSIDLNPFDTYKGRRKLGANIYEDNDTEDDGRLNGTGFPKQPVIDSDSQLDMADDGIEDSSLSDSYPSMSSERLSDLSEAEELLHIDPNAARHGHPTHDTNIPFLESLKMLNIDENNESSTSDRHQTTNEEHRNKTKTHRRAKQSNPREQQSTVHPPVPQYSQTFADWSAIYWNQVNHIHQYVSLAHQHSNF